MLSAHLYVCAAVGASVDLDQLSRDGAIFLNLMKERKQHNAWMLTIPFVQLVCNLKGDALDPLVLTGEWMDEEAELPALQSNGTAFVSLLIDKALIAVILNEYKVAETALAKMQPERVNAMYQSLARFLLGLTHLIRASNACGLRRWLELRAGKRQLELVRHFASSNSYQTPHVKILEAKLALCNGKVDSALALFETAITSSREDDNRMGEALAAEHAGLALCDNHRPDEGKRYLRDAQLVYEQWGAHAKVKQMTKLYFS